MFTSAALPTILPSAVTSEASFLPEFQSQLSMLISQLIQQVTAAVANQIACTTSNPLPTSIPGAPPVSQIQFSAPTIPSRLATTSDNLSPASALDTHPPLISIVTQPKQYSLPSIPPRLLRTCQLLPITSSFHSLKGFLYGLLLLTYQALHFHYFQLLVTHRIILCHCQLLYL